MLYINGKKASRLQNSLHALYNECKQIKKTIIEYNKLIAYDNPSTNEIMEKYPLLFSTTLDCMRYRIIIGMGHMFDNNRNSLSIEKIMNMFEQVGNKELNKIKKDFNKKYLEFAELQKNIKELRDKMYAHIDIKSSLEYGDVFDIDFEFLNKQIIKSKELIDYVMETCVKISKEYDNDVLHLAINWKYDK